MEYEREFQFNYIGVIRTPYTDRAPYQPVDSEEDRREYKIVVDPVYQAGLNDLDKFDYIYVIYHLNKITKPAKMMVNPPWAGGKQVGLFASRSPLRPNPIGLSIVRVKKIVDNIVFTSVLDVFDKTPLLDMKPYIAELDSKSDANNGWVEELGGKDHLKLHIQGISHDY